MKKKLAEKKENEAKNKKEEAAIEAIINDSEMDIPDAMVETQQRQMVEEFAQRLQMQGLSLDQYFQFTGLNVQMMLDQVKPQAEKRIKSRLVLEAVAEAENFEVTEEELEKELARMGEMYQMEVEKVKELLDDYQKDQIKKDLKVQKAVEFIVENAKEGKAAAKRTIKKKADKEEKVEE